MRADYSDGYYYVSSDSDSLAGEESSILRVDVKEFESFIDNFILARALNNAIGVNIKEAVLKALDSNEKKVKRFEDTHEAFKKNKILFTDQSSKSDSFSMAREVSDLLDDNTRGLEEHKAREKTYAVLMMVFHHYGFSVQG